MFLCGFYWLISFLYLLRNHSLHTDIITEMDFLGEGGKLEGEAEAGERRGEERKPPLRLFIIHKSVYFSRETRPLSGMESRLFLPSFYLPLSSIHFPPFLLFPGFLHTFKCQTNKTEKQNPLPLLHSLSQTSCMFSILIKVPASTVTYEGVDARTHNHRMHVVEYISRVGSV